MFVERRELRRPDCGNFRKLLLEYLVGEVAQRRVGSKVCRQRHDLAYGWVIEPRTNRVVNLDVGAAESEDRLLRIANDKKGAGTKRQSAPVDRVLSVGSAPAFALRATADRKAEPYWRR